MEDPFVRISVILVSLFASAFFSGVEIAFVSANRLKIELDRQQGNLGAKILSYFYKNASRFIGTMLVGNNIALVIYGIYMGEWLTSLVETNIPFAINELALLITQTIVSTLIILVTAEFIPKTFFSINPNNLLNYLSVPLVILYTLLWLPTGLFVGISEAFLRLFFSNVKQGIAYEFSKVDLDNYLREAVDTAQDPEGMEHEIQIFHNAMEFSDLKVRDCMVPRSDLIAIDVECEIEELITKFVETHFSKILIYRDNLDNIIGYAHSSELFKKPTSIKNVILPVHIVTEAAGAQDVLQQLTSSNKSIAVVVDEFGGTSGILTTEDIIEQIFGEIDDEHDIDEGLETKVSDNEYLFAGKLEIDYLNDKYKFNLPESEEYNTLAGLIISHLEDIPEANTAIHIKDYKFTVNQVSESKIDQVKFKVL